jgi:hypothetical protein
MVFAKMRFSDGHTESMVCNRADYAWHVLHGTKSLFYLPFQIDGKTYQERKESLRNLAIDFQHADDGDTDVTLSYGEIGDIADFFERMGKKYGLLREFEENGII